MDILFVKDLNLINFLIINSLIMKTLRKENYTNKEIQEIEFSKIFLHDLLFEIFLKEEKIKYLTNIYKTKQGIVRRVEFFNIKKKKVKKALAKLTIPFNSEDICLIKKSNPILQIKTWKI